MSVALVPRVWPKYVVRKERRVYLEHSFPDGDRPLRADVTVMSDTGGPSEPAAPASAAAAVTPVVLNLPMPGERREAFLTLRDRESMEVVTVIELLSPANRRPGGDGRREYRSKRESLLASATHLVELGHPHITVDRTLPPLDADGRQGLDPRSKRLFGNPASGTIFLLRPSG